MCIGVVNTTSLNRVFTCTFFLDFDLLGVADATVQIIKTLEVIPQVNEGMHNTVPESTTMYHIMNSTEVLNPWRVHVYNTVCVNP